MIKYGSLFISIVLLLSCKEKHTTSPDNSKQFGNISFNLPTKAKFLEVNGVDSHIAYIIINKDTIFAEFGKPGIINNLFYIQRPVFPYSQKDSILNTITKDVSENDIAFSNQPEQDQQINIFDKNYWTYDTLNNITVKIILPKKIGSGITGIYIPELKGGNSLSMYGENLGPANHLKVIEMFRTIRYK